jgi:energy-coupling factor transporter ATP-binding protein EcfA2
MLSTGQPPESAIAIEVRGLSFAYGEDAPDEAKPCEAERRQKSPKNGRGTQRRVLAERPGECEPSAQLGVCAPPMCSCGRPVLEDIGFRVAAGAVAVIIGPSGCGKTTLLRCLTGVIPRVMSGRLSGSVRVLGMDVSGDKELSLAQIARHVGFVMQEPDHQIVMTTVEDDIAFGLENRMAPPAEIRMAVDGMIGEVGLSGKAEHSPQTLSGGEKQRLAIGGVLAVGPELLVFDEPTSNLDAAGKDLFLTRAKRLREEGKTIVVVEHDFERFGFADCWVLMKDGHILYCGAPQDAPADLLEGSLWR